MDETKPEEDKEHAQEKESRDWNIDVLGQSIIEVKNRLQDFKVSTYTRLLVIESKIVSLDQRLFNEGTEPNNRPNEEQEIINITKKDEGSSAVSQDTPMIKKSFMADFCSNISLAGLRYVADEEEPKLHRIMWVVLHFTAIMVSLHYVQDAYNLWQNSPIVQSINNTLTRVDNIPFPAVTLCEPFIIEIDDYFENVGRCIDNKTNWICSNEELDILELTHILLPTEVLTDKQYFLEELLRYKLYSNHTFSSIDYLKLMELLKKKWISYKRYPMMHSSHWSCTKTLCPDIYISFPFVRGVSVCKIYNGVHHGPQYIEIDIKNANYIGQQQKTKNMQMPCFWAPEKIFDNACTTGSQPVYSSRPLNIPIYNVYSDPNHHIFKLIPYDIEPVLSIDNPANYPNLEENAKKLPIDQNVKVTLSPRLVTAGMELSEISANKRGCVFSSEIKLVLFKFYTQRNCLFECKVDCILKHCGCLPYYYVPIYNTSLRICGYKKSSECHYITYANDSYSDFCRCDCPPDCVFLDYDVEIITSVRGTGSPILTIGYKALEIPSNYRYSVSSWSEFVAYSLGILGLINGFSLMVVWETLYLLTLRLWVTVNRIS